MSVGRLELPTNGLKGISKDNKKPKNSLTRGFLGEKD